MKKKANVISIQDPKRFLQSELRKYLSHTATSNLRTSSSANAIRSYKRKLSATGTHNNRLNASLCAAKPHPKTNETKILSKSVAGNYALEHGANEDSAKRKKPLELIYAPNRKLASNLTSIPIRTLTLVYKKEGNIHTTKQHSITRPKAQSNAESVERSKGKSRESPTLRNLFLNIKIALKKAVKKNFPSYNSKRTKCELNSGLFPFQIKKGYNTISGGGAIKTLASEKHSQAKTPINVEKTVGMWFIFQL